MAEFSFDMTCEDAEAKQVVDSTPKCAPKKMRTVTVQGTFASKMTPYLVALRPWSFTASLCPVGLGSCLAYKAHGTFNIWIFITTCICALSVHAAGNLVNTYFDYVKGVDNKKSEDRILVDHILRPNDVVTMGAFSYFIGCIGCMILSYISPSPMEHIALVYFGGLSGSFLYTGGLGLKYIALGDIAIFLTFGPITVLFAYISQGGKLSISPLLYAIPLALNAEAILHANNTRDIEVDKETGIITLAIMLGKGGSYVLFVLLLFSPYLSFVYLAVNVSSWFFLPLVTVFSAFSVERQFRHGNLERMPHTIAKLNLIIALCYICACLFTDASFLRIL